MSDPANPTRVAQATVPNATSGAEWDHHAFLWWSASGLAAIPVSAYEPQPFEGLVGFTVDTEANTITERGRVTHPATQPAAIPNGKPMPVEPDIGDAGAGTDAGVGVVAAPPWSFPSPILRSFVIGDRLWTLSTAGLRRAISRRWARRTSWRSKRHSAVKGRQGWPRNDGHGGRPGATVTPLTIGSTTREGWSPPCATAHLGARRFVEYVELPSGPARAGRVDDDADLRTGTERVPEREELDLRLAPLACRQRRDIRFGVGVERSERRRLIRRARGDSRAASRSARSVSLPSGRTSVSVTCRSTSVAVGRSQRSTLPVPTITVSVRERRASSNASALPAAGAGQSHGGERHPTSPVVVAGQSSSVLRATGRSVYSSLRAPSARSATERVRPGWKYHVVASVPGGGQGEKSCSKRGGRQRPVRPPAAVLEEDAESGSASIDVASALS